MAQIMIRKIVIFSCLSLSLTGCIASLPKKFSFNVDKQVLPENWVTASEDIKTIDTPKLDDLINDEGVQALIISALVNSPNVRQSALRLKEAELAIGRESSALWPSVTINTNGKRSKEGETSEGRSPVKNSVDASLGLSWELDIWGRLSDTRNATELEADAVVDDVRGVRSLLVANLMRSWVKRGSSFEIAKVESDRIHSLETAEDIIAGRYADGLGNLGDLDAARSATQSAFATWQIRINDYEQETRRLNVLSGQVPSYERGSPQRLAHISLPALDTPINVIGRRPDMAAAFRRIKSADKTASATYKDILPSFKLSADVTASGSRLSQIVRFDPAWSLIGALSAPIFDAGLRKTKTEIAETVAQRQWENYRTKLLSALEEVENALALERNLKAQEDARLKARDYAISSYQQQLEKYSAGLSDVITLLTSERTAFDAKIAYLDVRRQRMENRIILALALGFGV